ncbi:hypothetical protein J2I47_26260 [Fibrella sp. HMF5335]|uniref:Uncharacterized protein n=1 Tax=Fibrella rubiginis TaxID=2817060 RepID=A0A939K836_9BACT|nr:hypothetical protein [Fibrella rubiginis]MBO0940076.1 hypothetical protein [Fibrella rubiginis]
MAKFLEIMGPGPSKLIFNIDQVVFVQATSGGCRIQLSGDNAKSINISYVDMKKALENTQNSPQLIFSVVDDNLPDATPPSPPFAM